MKSALVSLDTHRTGRVPLSRFYNSALESDWRFGESEAYLRELGALDETSTWHGKQVIIANYIQAASNCIVSSPHYLVCCSNPCEGLMGDIERAVAAPLASPAELLAVVGNMSAQSELDDDVLVDLGSGDGSLAAQLEQIAAAHSGQVPLHGRLFAQWLHYVFPRQCPFPHKVGDASSASPLEFGEGYIASDEEMQAHAVAANETVSLEEVGQEGVQWMSQWSEEEELIADYSASGLHAPWESRRRVLSIGGALLVLVGLVGAVGHGSGSKGPALLPVHGKSHFV